MSDSQTIASFFPFPAIRCRRIIRDTETFLGDLRLDGQTAYELGASHIGVLAGGGLGIGDLIDKFRELSTSGLPGQVVIALSTKSLADEYFARWGMTDVAGDRDEFWSSGCVTFTTPEKLRTVGKQQLDGRRVLAVVLVDPPGIVHKARGDAQRGFAFNDRPQHIAKFRAQHEIGDWRPPFFLFTERPAKSLSTNQMLGPFSLEAWWFVDGRAIRMGVPPTIPAAVSPVCEEVVLEAEELKESTTFAAAWESKADAST